MPLRTFYHQGQTFVLGRHGQRYNIRIHNHGGRRAEVVIAVDGRDAVSGEPSNPASQRGYVIPAYGSVSVSGFRQSLTSVAAFRFADKSASYAARMGSSYAAIGAIRVAVFPERVRPVLRLPPPYLDYDEGRSAPAAGAAEADASRAPAPSYKKEGGYSSRRDRLGTEYGETRHSRVVEVSFERQNPYHPSQTVTLRYDDAEGLEARGIAVYPRPHPVYPVAEPPIYVPEPRFAQPPPFDPWGR